MSYRETYGTAGILVNNPYVGLTALGLLAGCAAPAQSASNPLNSAQVQPLIGSTPTTLSAEFGQPTLLRIDGTAQVWLYQSTSCGLNLVLYPDTAGTPRVAMVSTGDGTAAEDCTASLQHAHFDAAVNPSAIAAALEPPAPS